MKLNGYVHFSGTKDIGIKHQPDQIKNLVEEARDHIIDVSHFIHSTPELGKEEFKSSQKLCDELKALGYEVTKGVGLLETAFVAKRGSSSGPVVAILAEYDALPGIGHGCGHNIIAATAYGVATGFADIIDVLEGQIRIIGTPAEENGGGKIELLKEGIFDDVDFALMVHPDTKNMVQRGGMAFVGLSIAYQGKRAHSAVPEEGINALKALIHTFTGFDALLGECPQGVNVHGIITNGGEAANIIPEYASAEFSIRGHRLHDLKIVKEKMLQVIKASEVLTGATASYTFDPPYAERYPNHTMGEAFKEAMEEMGEVVVYPEKNVKYGSSDIGNLSLKLPVIHAYVKIGEGVDAHTKAFTEASISPEADDMLIKASKALAVVTYRLFTDSSFRFSVKEEFEKTVPDYRDFRF